MDILKIKIKNMMSRGVSLVLSGPPSTSPYYGVRSTYANQKEIKEIK